MSRKIIILGGGGQLGVELFSEFERRGWIVERFDRQALDVRNAEAVERAVGQSDPQVVVNAAAYNQVDIAEREPLQAFQANALAVRNLAVACRQLGAQLVHYSTDYVFDGSKGSPYTEEDRPHPLGAYAVSKLAGEYYAQAYLEDPLLLRVSGVFGPAGRFTPRGNFVELMLRLAGGNQPVRVVGDFYASPTYAPAIAARSVDMMEKGLGGLFHMGGGEAISWYEYAQMIFELAGLSPTLIRTNEREYRTTARRPKFSALSNDKLYRAGIAPMPPLREAVAEYLNKRELVTAHRAV